MGGKYLFRQRIIVALPFKMRLEITNQGGKYKVAAVGGPGYLCVGYEVSCPHGNDARQPGGPLPKHLLPGWLEMVSGKEIAEILPCDEHRAGLLLLQDRPSLRRFGHIGERPTIRGDVIVRDRGGMIGLFSETIGTDIEFVDL